MLQSQNLLWTFYADTLQQLSTKLSEMTGLDQEALVKLAIAGAFDATSENQDNNDTHDAAIVTQSVDDDQSAMHRAEGMMSLFHIGDQARNSIE